MSKFIFDFVHSMAMREKAYFKRFATTYSSNVKKNYLELYDFIENMKVYDAQEFKAHFSSKPMGKYLSSEINYLLDQLLKSLTNYHFESSPKNQLQKEVIYINLLLERGFNAKANKLLMKAKKKAYFYEDFTLILSLIQLEEEIQFHEGIIGFTNKLFELQKEREIISSKISNLNQLRILREQVRDLQFSVGFVPDTSLFPEIFSHPLLESVDEAKSIRAKEHWYYIKDFCSYLTRDYHESVKVSAHYLKFVESNIALFKNSKLLPLLSNYLHNCALVGDDQKFNSVLAKLVKLEKDPNLDGVYIKYIKYTRILEHFYNQGDKGKSMEIIAEVEGFVGNHLESLEIMQSEYLLRLMIRAFVVNLKFKEALKWLNHIYGARLIDYTLDQTRIYGMIIYFELEWHEKLQSEIETAYKVLKKHGKLNQLSVAFIQFFKAFLRRPEKEKDLLEKLEKELAQISKNESMNHPFEHFNYLDWLEAYKARKKIKSDLSLS